MNDNQIRAGLETTLRIYGPAEGVAVISAGGRYVIRDGTRFICVAGGEVRFNHPCAASDPDSPGTIAQHCQWSTFGKNRAERIVKRLMDCGPEYFGASNPRVETIEDACTAALALLS